MFIYYKRCNQALILSTFLTSSFLYANNNNFYENAFMSPSMVATLSLGGARASQAKEQTIYITPYIKRTYLVSDSAGNLGVGELFLGLQTELYSNFYRNNSSEAMLGRLGLALGTANSMNISGVVWDNADPQADNYVYGYQVRHSYLTLKGQILLDTNSLLIPWISASAGIGLNNASSFESTPTIEEALPVPPFASKKTTALTYAVGVGVQKALGVHWQIGLGYEFSDWGKSELGTAVEQTLETNLVQNHTYTNSILFNITFLA